MNGALSIVRTNTDQIMESFIAVFRNCTAWFTVCFLTTLRDELWWGGTKNSLR